MELSTSIFDLLIHILVVLWFKSTWIILEIKDCTQTKYQYCKTSKIVIYHNYIKFFFLIFFIKKFLMHGSTSYYI